MEGAAPISHYEGHAQETRSPHRRSPYCGLVYDLKRGQQTPLPEKLRIVEDLISRRSLGRGSASRALALGLVVAAQLWHRRRVRPQEGENLPDQAIESLPEMGAFRPLVGGAAGPLRFQRTRGPMVPTP